MEGGFAHESPDGILFQIKSSVALHLIVEIESKQTIV